VQLKGHFFVAARVAPAADVGAAPSPAAASASSQPRELAAADASSQPRLQGGGDDDAMSGAEPPSDCDPPAALPIAIDLSPDDDDMDYDGGGGDDGGDDYVRFYGADDYPDDIDPLPPPTDGADPLPSPADSGGALGAAPAPPERLQGKTVNKPKAFAASATYTFRKPHLQLQLESFQDSFIVSFGSSFVESFGIYCLSPAFIGQVEVAKHGFL